MSTFIEEDRYLTPGEASLLSRRSIRTLARMRAEGRGPRYHRDGKKILYPLAGLHEWLLDRMVVPSSI